MNVCLLFVVVVVVLQVPSILEKMIRSVRCLSDTSS